MQATPTPHLSELVDPFVSQLEAPFEIMAPASQRVPVVFASPHSGRVYPDRFKAQSCLDDVALRRSEDAFVDALYQSAPDHGAPLLMARFPRAYVDPNREAWELDPQMFNGPLPDHVNTTSPRVRAGLGTMAKVVTDGADIYKDKLDFSEAQLRIEHCYQPYHGALKNLLDETHKHFGAHLLIDCHSMPSVGGPMDQDPGLGRVDMVLGDAGGTSCTRLVRERVQEILQGMGYRVVLNTPYAGGFTTRHYGKPFQARHALQIEVNRALYMNEDTITRNDGFDTLKNNLDQLIKAIATFTPEQLSKP